MNKILPPSQLPLNKDGSIYHLCLHPGELATTIILVGDPQRAAKVAHYFDDVELQKASREFVTYTGRIGQQRLSVVSTGIGTGSVDIALNEIDALHNIDFKQRCIKDQPTQLRLIRLGTCGALQPEIAPDQLIFSQYALGFDGAINFYQHHISADEHNLLDLAQTQLDALDLNSIGYAASADTSLSKLFQPLTQGITLTCPGFYGAQHRPLRLQCAPQTDLFNQLRALNFQALPVLNFEMETAYLYALGKALGHQYASISTVIYNRITEQQSHDPAQAIEKMIEYCLPLFT